MHFFPAYMFMLQIRSALLEREKNSHLNSVVKIQPKK